MEDEEQKKPEVSDKPEEGVKGVSLVEEARAIRDDIAKQKEELKAENDRKEKLQAEELLGSSAGGHVEAEKVSPEDKKKEDAKEFFKGTALADAIDKA